MSPWNPYQPPADGLPPQEVRISKLDVEPWPDGRRVRVSIELTPFLERPDLDIVITDDHLQEVASAAIIGSIDSMMTFTMHLRGDNPQSPFTLAARLHYPEIGEVHQEKVSFETSQPQPPDSAEP